MFGDHGEAQPVAWSHGISLDRLQRNTEPQPRSLKRKRERERLLILVGPS